MSKRAKQHDFLKNGGEMGKRIAAMNWADHPFGPIETWPQSLTSALSICLLAKLPMAIYWGDDLRLLYNDAWAPIPGDKHPEAIGQPAEEVWSDIWHLIGPDMLKVLGGKEGSVHENELLPMKRRGYIEESYFDYTFSPIYGENQEIVGVFNAGQEVTSRILHGRRMRTLRKLTEKSITAESPEAACILAANALSENPADLPFAIIYLLSPDKKSLKLMDAAGIDAGTSIAHYAIDLEDNPLPLPYRKVMSTKKMQHAKSLNEYYELPGGVWDEPATEAIFLPLIHPYTKELYGVFVGGLSARLDYDTNYSSFMNQLAEQTALSIGNAFDLKRKLQLEDRERQAQQRLQTALSTGAIGIWTWDIANNKVIADQNLAYRFGVDYEEAQEGLPLSIFTDSIHPDDRSWVLAKIQESVAKTKYFEAEYRTVTRDGAVKWVMARGRVEDDEHGNAIRFPGVMVDITDRKEIERELASSERMFNALFESSILGVAIMTLDGKIHDANERFLAMFGYQRTELDKGLYTHMITPSKSKGVTSMFYQMLRKKGEVDPMEKEYVRKDNSTIPVLAGGVMIPGSTDRFIAFMLDISKQKELLAVNKAKDEFISIASHQLRTPATGVKQYLGMMIEGYAGELTKKQTHMLHTAYASNERQLTIVNDLLRVAQADANEIVLRPKKTDISRMLGDIISESTKKFEADRQTIELIVKCKQSIIEVDSLHMRMVFENLIDNAHKYTPAGKNVTVTLYKQGNKLHVSVKDEGVGIYKKDMPKLFKKFSRVDNPLSTSAGGTGLGLYFVQKIVALHSGSIEVSSRYRSGTEFTVILPQSQTNT